MFPFPLVYMESYIFGVLAFLNAYTVQTYNFAKQESKLNVLVLVQCGRHRLLFINVCRKAALDYIIIYCNILLI